MIRKVLLLAVFAAGCAGDPSGDKPAREKHSPAATTTTSPTSEAVLATPSPAPPSDEHPDENYPLQEWMSANLARPVKAQDFPALERALGSLASIGPDQFPDWKRFAKAGAIAAAAKDIDRVRASCTDCHQTYRAEYRAQMRTRPLPEMRSAR